MKRRSILFFILCSLFFSCQEQSKERLLIDRAEALAVSYPDSARMLLDNIAVPEILSDKQLARWCMLSGKVADKLFKDMPYVSQLKRASEWYKRWGTREEQAWIGLYLGRSYFEDQLYLQASEAYSEALAIALEGGAYNATGYICSYTGDLYEYTGQISEERRKYEEAAMYFEKADNLHSYALALRDIAKTWAFDDSCSLALEYMLTADSVLLNSGNLEGEGEIISGLGNIYRMTGETDKARECYLKSLTLDTLDIAPVYLALSDMYCSIDNFDSARFFLEKANIETLNKYTPAGVLYGYYELEKANDNYKKALHYFEQYEAVKDSLYDIHKQADIVDAEKRYNHLLLLDENRELWIDRLILVVLLSVCLIICLLGWIIYQEKNKRAIRKMLILQQTLEGKESELGQLIAEQKEKEIESSKRETILNKYKKEIKTTQEDITQFRNQKFSATAIVKKVKRLSSKIVVGNDKPLLTVSDWEVIVRQLDTIYVGLPNFLKRKEWNLTHAELEICYLSFFNLEVYQEAILLNINSTSVSKRRLRLREKLGLKHTLTPLSDFLLSLM